jgi:hypothetical protein
MLKAASVLLDRKQEKLGYQTKRIELPPRTHFLSLSSGIRSLHA